MTKLGSRSPSRALCALRSTALVAAGWTTLATATALASGSLGDPPGPAPIEAAIIVGPPPALDAIASRLDGHRIHRGDHVLILEDLAGAGRPWVGVVSARCGQLWLDTAVTSLRLTGPLARPRLAGPGYLVWAIGHRAASGDSLSLSRLGILARPDELPALGATSAAGAAASARPCP